MSTEDHVDPVERAIREAIARGDFDRLPGAGRPIPDLDRQYDPDWWARRYLEGMKADDAADDLRRTIRAELPRLRVAADRQKSQSRIDELNALVAAVNRRLPESRRIEEVRL